MTLSRILILKPRRSSSVTEDKDVHNLLKCDKKNVTNDRKVKNEVSASDASDAFNRVAGCIKSNFEPTRPIFPVFSSSRRTR